MTISEQVNELVRVEPGVYTQADLSRQFTVSRERIRQIVNKCRLRQFLQDRASDQIERLVRAEPGVYTRKELSRRFNLSYGRASEIIIKYKLQQFVKEQKCTVRRRVVVVPEQKPEVEVIPEQEPEAIEVELVPVRTTRVMVCPRCSAPLVLERDHYGWYEDCIFCGYENSLDEYRVQSEYIVMATSGGLV